MKLERRHMSVCCAHASASVIVQLPQQHFGCSCFLLCDYESAEGIRTFIHVPVHTLSNSSLTFWGVVVMSCGEDVGEKHEGPFSHTCTWCSHGWTFHQSSHFKWMPK
ncbi:hypothetical protein DUNSADRAFT_12943 [Dunaliella salina]|uniref:Encoded protein n=1 Tax=Dunaliella salina TaxID=3046 RepID=A0ABQ7GAF2_DUNSA|nr:hypothetical protein DUNSADRAFT_12943 [Dunaliella salina]|eukprot:KAF5831587.1 hypothetical protein DUNSADRAFT_12943 [Dunaliella salina]